MSNLQFESLAAIHGADILYHRETNGERCPCVTEEGFRDPEWHRLNPPHPICNDDGFINVVVLEQIVKGYIQPLYGGIRYRLNQFLLESFGELQVDDRLGVFPITSGNVTLNFDDWSDSGADWIEFRNKRYIVIAVNEFSSPENGDIPHHFEVSLRLINQDI